MRAETVHALVLLGSIAGLAFSIFAWVESVVPSLQGACSVNAFISCSKVDQSGLTTTLGVQDYAWGIAGFLLLLALDVPLYRTWKPSWLRALALVSLAGGLFSVYLGYLELGVIHALCPVCLGAYLCNALVLAGSLYLVRLGRASAGTGPGDGEPGKTPG